MTEYSDFIPINISDYDYNVNSSNATLLLDPCRTHLEKHPDYTQLPYVVYVIVTAYIIIMIPAVLGNLLVIVTIWKHNHMRTVTNYYILNLAISDFLVSAIVMPLKLLEYTAPCEWQVFSSDILCSVISYLLPIFVFTSVLTLVAISLERYYAIVHPLAAMKINSKSRTKKILATTWVLPVIVASPYLFCQKFSFVLYSDYGEISRQICTDRFDEIDMMMYGSDDRSKLGSFRKGFFFFLFFVIYLIPMIVIVTTCIMIALSLLKPITVDKEALRRKNNKRRHEENKRKVARMVIVVAMAFIISWSAQYLVSIVSQLQTVSFLREGNFIFTMLMTHFLGFVNSCLNPFIYTAMSKKFRRSFRQIICRMFGCKCAKRQSTFHEGSFNCRANRTIMYRSNGQNTATDIHTHEIVTGKTKNTGGAASGYYPDSSSSSSSKTSSYRKKGALGRSQHNCGAKAGDETIQLQSLSQHTESTNVTMLPNLGVQTKYQSLPSVCSCTDELEKTCKDTGSLNGSPQVLRQIRDSPDSPAVHRYGSLKCSSSTNEHLQLIPMIPKSDSRKVDTKAVLSSDQSRPVRLRVCKNLHPSSNGIHFVPVSLGAKLKKGPKTKAKKLELNHNHQPTCCLTCLQTATSPLNGCSHSYQQTPC